jgi:hypothetical protein
MICALTVRRLKPGTFEDFKAALQGGPLWPDLDAQSRASAGKRFYALRNAEDENEVITFGFFDLSVDELRARQAASEGYRQRRQATDHYVESKPVDGLFEVLAERVLG